MATTGDALDEIISAIGDSAFPARAGRALAALTGFDLVAIVAHRPGRPSAILFDDFDRLGCRGGIERYARSTHRINPMLAGRGSARRSGAWRARDFRGAFAPDRATDEVIAADDEELGYRTIGWPARHEEIGLWADDGQGVVEIGLYRERAAKAASPRTMQALVTLRQPVTAAFRRHAALAKTAPDGRTRIIPAPIAVRLTPREREVAELLLRGCSSDTVALRLSISRHTVKDHRKHIFARLGISSLAELFALAA